jgi:hypothetical protein
MSNTSSYFVEKDITSGALRAESTSTPSMQASLIQRSIQKAEDASETSLQSRSLSHRMRHDSHLGIKKTETISQ